MKKQTIIRTIVYIIIIGVIVLVWCMARTSEKRMARSEERASEIVLQDMSYLASSYPGAYIFNIQDPLWQKGVPTADELKSALSDSKYVVIHAGVSVSQEPEGWVVSGRAAIPQIDVRFMVTEEQARALSGTSRKLSNISDRAVLKDATRYRYPFAILVAKEVTVESLAEKKVPVLQGELVDLKARR